ncbi:MAG: DUF1491 family protein [Alphaproteobacteria bacterium]|nr:DUF1491 family protein [Alphaproteobacteria bacterium]
MTEARLSTRLWVQAMIRRCSVDGLTAVLVRRGDEDRGAVMLKVNRFDGGCTVWTQTRTMDGAPAWMRGTGPDAVVEQAADAYVERQIKRDPDLWVVEIEDRHGRYVPDGTVV